MIDLQKLVGVKNRRGKIEAQCPACAMDGNDSKNKNHLIVYPDGRFGCVAHPNDNEHRRLIYALAGDGSRIDNDDAQERIADLYRVKKLRENLVKAQAEKTKLTIPNLETYAYELAEASPITPDERFDDIHFIQANRDK